MPKVIVIRRRRLVVREVENADIDRRNDNARLLARGQAGKLDRHAKRRVRPHRRGQFHVDGKRVGDLVDREPLHADCAARHTLRGGVERAAQSRNHVGARSPVAANVEAHARGTGLDVLRLAGDQPVGENIHGQPAAGPRRHRHVHRVARFVV